MDILKVLEHMEAWNPEETTHAENLEFEATIHRFSKELKTHLAMLARLLGDSESMKTAVNMVEVTDCTEKHRQQEEFQAMLVRIQNGGTP